MEINKQSVTSEATVGIVPLQAPKVQRRARQKLKGPAELLADLRARENDQADPAKDEAPTFDELISERRRRHEEEYCEGLRSQGKQVFAADDVVALGYKLDPSWTQKDLQTRMLVGPVLQPLKVLQKKADDYHQTFVIPGRKAVLEMMVEVYRLYLLAVLPERCEAVFEKIRGNVESRMKKKLAEDVTNASLFIRYVFQEFDDRKVHLYSRALDFAWSSNVSADDFKAWVERFGGWEKVRKEAATAFANSPDVISERLRKSNELKEAESLVDRWRTLRGVIGSVELSGELPKKLGATPRRVLLEVTWLPDFHEQVGVYAGQCEVIDILPLEDAVVKALRDMRVAEARLQRDRLKKSVDALEDQAYEALDDETKARYDKLAEVSASVRLKGEANAEVRRGAQHESAELKSFV